VFFSQPNAEEVTLVSEQHFGRSFEFVASSDVHARLLAHASSPPALAEHFGGDAALMAARVAEVAAMINKRLDGLLEDGHEELSLPAAEAHAQGLLCGARREGHEDPKAFVAGRCFEGDLALFARLVDVMRGAWRRLRGSEFKGKSAAEKAAAIAAEGDGHRNVLTWSGGVGGGSGLRDFNAAGEAGAGPPVGVAEADGGYLGAGIEHLADAASAANANASAAALALPSVSGHGNDTVVRKVLFADQKEIMEYANSLSMLFTTRASDVTDPWDLHGCRMAHGEAIRWLEYNQHQELADAVRRRGAFQAKVWAMHQETPDCFNRAVHELRPQNRLPYPPRDGTFPHLDYVLEQLEAHGPELFEEYMELNGHDLLNGHVQHEHEQGLQEYFLKDAVWHRTTFWKGALRPCMLGSDPATGGGFAKNCAFFKRIEDYWAETLGHRRQYFVEVKWLVVHPGVWIRPHTADNNQNFKMHYCVQNPGNHYRMIAANSTRVWEPKRAVYLQDAFVHQVRTGAPHLLVLYPIRLLLTRDLLLLVSLSLLYLLVATGAHGRAAGHGAARGAGHQDDPPRHRQQPRPRNRHLHQPALPRRQGQAAARQPAAREARRPRRRQRPHGAVRLHALAQARGGAPRAGLPRRVAPGPLRRPGPRPPGVRDLAHDGVAGLLPPLLAAPQEGVHAPPHRPPARARLGLVRRREQPAAVPTVP
jgi:hypothetical protein